MVHEFSGAKNALSALLDSATTQPEPALGLAAVYQDLPKPRRAAFRAAVLRDAGETAGDARPALLALLAVERDLHGARELFDGLKHLTSRPPVISQAAISQAATPQAEAPGLCPTSRETAWLMRGDDSIAGWAVPLYGPFVGFWLLSWNAQELRVVDHAPLVSLDEAERRMDRRRVPRANPLEVRSAIVATLWQRRRDRLALPESVRPLGRLL